MTQANESNDRLRYAQMSPQGFTGAFDRVYDDIDDLEGVINARFDRVNERFDRLQSEIQDLNRKFDIVMQHITEQSDN